MHFVCIPAKISTTKVVTSNAWFYDFGPNIYTNEKFENLPISFNSCKSNTLKIWHS